MTLKESVLAFICACGGGADKAQTTPDEASIHGKDGASGIVEGQDGQDGEDGKDGVNGSNGGNGGHGGSSVLGRGGNGGNGGDAQ